MKKPDKGCLTIIIFIVAMILVAGFAMDASAGLMLLLVLVIIIAFVLAIIASAYIIDKIFDHFRKY